VVIAKNGRILLFGLLLRAFAVDVSDEQILRLERNLPFIPLGQRGKEGGFADCRLQSMQFK